MPATFQEVQGSRKVSSQGMALKYIAQGVTTASEIVTWVNGLSDTLNGYLKSDYEAQENDKIPGDYEITVNWSTIDETVYSFNFTAPSAHLYQSLGTIAVFRDTAIFPTAAPDFKGAINVVWDEGKQRVEGQNIQAPAEVFTYSYSGTPAIITGAYLATVRGLCGKVHGNTASTFQGVNPGETMLVRAVGARTGLLWDLEFGFSYIPNTTGETYGDITGVAKQGHDLLWPYYVPVKDGAAQELVRRPAAMYVDRVFRQADLNALNL